MLKYDALSVSRILPECPWGKKVYFLRHSLQTECRRREVLSEAHKHRQTDKQRAYAASIDKPKDRQINGEHMQQVLTNLETDR
jgi:hypothetical protein